MFGDVNGERIFSTLFTSSPTQIRVRGRHFYREKESEFEESDIGSDKLCLRSTKIEGVER